MRLASVLAAAPQRQLVVTDVRGHWARPWIEATARAGAMEVFSNYTFQPGTPLRRADVADVVHRVLSLMRGRSGPRSGIGRRSRSPTCRRATWRSRPSAAR